MKGASPDKGSRTSFAARRVVDEPKEPSREVGVDTAHPGSIGSCRISRCSIAFLTVHYDTECGNSVAEIRVKS